MSRPLVLTLALTACAPALDAEAPPAVGSTAQAIRNGQRAPRRTPMSEGQILAIGYLHDAGAADSAFCTGTVITPRLVATAKHCLTGLGPADVAFGVGMLPSQPTADLAVERIESHPDRDVSLLVLARPAQLDAPGLVPVAANRQPLDDSHTGHEVEVAGYGDTLEPDQFGRFFALVLLESIDDEYVLVNGQQREGLCFGDSGGPVLDVGADGQPVVLGVEHGGEDSCVGRDQLTRLDRLQAWIDGVAATVPADSDCGQESYQGRCEGNVAIWCHEDGRLARLDCEAEGRVCGFVDPETGFYCKSLSSCGGVTPHCEGEVRIFCNGDRAWQQDCTNLGGFCAQDAGGSLCVDADGVPIVEGFNEPDPPENLVSGGALPGGNVEPPPAGDAGVEVSESPRRKGPEFSGGCRAVPGAAAPVWPWLTFLAIFRRRRVCSAHHVPRRPACAPDGAPERGAAGRRAGG